MTIRWLGPVAVIVVLAILAAPACSPKISLFPDGSEPLRQFTLEGEAKGKTVLLIDVQGFLTDQADRGMLGSRPSPVQEVVSRLDLAEADEDVGAVVLKVNTPGGTTTASDVLYHEIAAFKEKTGKPVVVAMMDVAASGGYYLALPADHILAHPTTITGSVGVIFILPRVYGLFDELGVTVDVAKSGKHKDMGSPFRQPTEEENALMAAIVDQLADRFLTLVRQHRHLAPEALADVATARILTADQALGLGLVDEVGYLEDAFAKARELAGLDEDAPVVVYRREEWANDNPYNAQSVAPSGSGGTGALTLETGLNLPPRSGFYYLWAPGLTN